MELKEKETEIIRLNEELNIKIDDWIQKGTQIKQLEAKIERIWLKLMKRIRKKINS